MAIKISCGLTVLRLLMVCEFTLSSMVLPRPPSSPNHIPREIVNNDDGKYRSEKGLYNLLQLNTNVEKPNTDGYRLLEIELGTGEVDETNLSGLVRAVLRNEVAEEQQQHPELSRNNPQPEVIPNSILGVRDVGQMNYRSNRFMNDDEDNKRTLIRPPGSFETDDKLYYLKNTRPKVDVRVRGNTGNYGEFSTSSYDEKVSKKRRPKKYQKLNLGDPKSVDSKNVESRNDMYGNGESKRSSDESTTENMSVTSSELPKQIPAPPSFPNQFYVAQTTPVQKYSLRRTDILPGYGYDEP